MPNLEYENTKMGRRIYEQDFFQGTMFLIDIMQSETTVVSIAAVFFEKAAIIIAILAAII